MCDLYRIVIFTCRCSNPFLEKVDFNNEIYDNLYFKQLNLQLLSQISVQKTTISIGTLTNPVSIINNSYILSFNYT